MTQFLNSFGTPVTVKNVGYLLVYCPANMHFLVVVFNGKKLYLLGFAIFWLFPMVNIKRDFSQNSEEIVEGMQLLFAICVKHINLYDHSRVT